MEITPNIFDLALAAVWAYMGVRALLRGFIKEVLGLVGVVIAVLASAVGYEYLGELFQRISGIIGDWWYAVSFGTILAVVYFLFSYLGHMLSRLIHNGPFSPLDRLLGFATGLAKGLMVAYLIINVILLASPLQTPSVLKNSFLAPYVVQTGRYVTSLIPDDITHSLQKRSGLLSKFDYQSHSNQKSDSEKPAKDKK